MLYAFLLTVWGLCIWCLNMLDVVFLQGLEVRAHYSLLPSLPVEPECQSKNTTKVRIGLGTVGGGGGGNLGDGDATFFVEAQRCCPRWERALSTYSYCGNPTDGGNPTFEALLPKP